MPHGLALAIAHIWLSPLDNEAAQIVRAAAEQITLGAHPLKVLRCYGRLLPLGSIGAAGGGAPPEIIEAGARHVVCLLNHQSHQSLFAQIARIFVGDRGQPGNTVCNVVMRARPVINAVAATASNTAFKPAQLIDQLRIVEQPNAAGIDQRQQIAVEIGLRRRRLLVFDRELAEHLDRPRARVLVANYFVDVVVFQHPREFFSHRRRRERRPLLATASTTTTGFCQSARSVWPTANVNEFSAAARWIDEGVVVDATHRRALINVSFNCYDLDPGAAIDSYAAAGKACLIGEFSFRAVNSGLPNTNGAGPLVATQAERSACFRRYVVAALRRRAVVGYHWFEHADQPAQGRFDGENSNFGTVTIGDDIYLELTQAMTAVNAEAKRCMKPRRSPREAWEGHRNERVREIVFVGASSMSFGPSMLPNGKKYHGCLFARLTRRSPPGSLRHSALAVSRRAAVSASLTTSLL